MEIESEDLKDTIRGIESRKEAELGDHGPLTSAFLELEARELIHGDISER